MRSGAKATAEDDVKRERLLKKLETMLQQKFDAVSIDPFGSFVSAFHTKNSDIDVSLTIHPSAQGYNEEEERKYRDAQSGAPRPRAQRRQHRTKRVQLLAKFATGMSGYIIYMVTIPPCVTHLGLPRMAARSRCSSMVWAETLHWWPAVQTLCNLAPPGIF